MPKLSLRQKLSTLRLESDFEENVDLAFFSDQELALQRRFTLLRRFEYYYDVLRRARFAARCLAGWRLRCEQ